MIDTIMLDLDGTLLNFPQGVFINTYLAELKKVFARLGMDAELYIKALYIGTKAMIDNNGEMVNAKRFWDKFSDYLGLTSEQCKAIEAVCDNFYSNEFNTVKSVMGPSDISKRLVRALAAKGYDLVLATNPLFPPSAVASRLGWIGLKPQDFKLTTHYANSTYCKPNLGYYREIFTKINKAPTQTLMVGNSVTDDMCVRVLGTDTFLVTDCIENEAGADISIYRHGTFVEAETYLLTLPDING